MADVTLPQLGETVTEGTITQWFKQVGDTVAADEALFEVSTDKVDTEVPSPVAGTLTEIRVQEGETVDVGTVIAVVGDGDGAPAAAEPPRRPRRRRPRRRPPRKRRARGGGGRAEAPAAEAPAAEHRAGAGTAPADAAARRTRRRPSRSRAATPSAAKGILLSPVVRRLVNEHGLDPAAITGTGPGGRITRDDVLDHIDKTGSKPAAPGAGRAGRRPAAAGGEGRHRRRTGRRAAPRLPARRRRRSRPASATPRSSCRRSASSPAPT